MSEHSSDPAPKLAIMAGMSHQLRVAILKIAIAPKTVWSGQIFKETGLGISSASSASFVEMSQNPGLNVNSDRGAR